MNFIDRQLKNLPIVNAHMPVAVKDLDLNFANTNGEPFHQI